jgi:hypothetical protein
VSGDRDDVPCQGCGQDATERPSLAVALGALVDVHRIGDSGAKAA